jgi:hypothetical protein
MGWATATVLPLTAIAGVLIALTKPLGPQSFVLVIAVLAAAGIALTCAGLLSARSRRR